MWLRGSSDLNNLASDIYNLLTGASSANQRGSGQNGNGSQVSGTDAWTGLDATNKVIRSKDTYTPWTLPMLLWRGIPRFALRGDPGSSNVQVGKPTFTGTYNGGTNKAVFLVWVSTANGANGSLNGTVVTYQIMNAETGATVVSATTVSGWSGTTDTKLLAQGVWLTLTLNAGESFLANTINWARGYSTTYTQGVDYFPEGAKIDTTKTLTVGTVSGGANAYTLNTDYQVVSSCDSWPLPNDLSGNYHGTDWGGIGCFSGIHWQTGGTPPNAGANYYLNACSCFAAYVHINQSGTTLRLVPIEFWDGSTQKGRFISCLGWAAATIAYDSSHTITMSPFNGSPPGSTFINYWISVKADKIVMVLRGDPGNSGIYQAWTYQKATSLFVEEKLPWVCCAQNSGSNGMRTTHLYPTAFGYITPYWGRATFGYDTQHHDAVLNGALAGTTYTLNNFLSQYLFENQKWVLYPIYTEHQKGGYDTSGTFTNQNRSSGLKAKLRGIWASGSDNWSSLDELVDGSNTYLLVATSQGSFGASSASINNLAILEE